MKRGPLKFVLLWCGHICVFLGVVGIFLPIMPTTPFILVASACYARSSDKFHRALYENKIFGPMLKNWQDTRSISPRAKIFAVATIWVGIGLSSVFIGNPNVKVVLFTVGFFVSVFILTRRNPPRPVPKES